MRMRTIGLMSGTSLDGIDAAFVETDGLDDVVCGPAMTIRYDRGFRERLRGALGGEAPSEFVADLERELTELHAIAVERLRAETGERAIDLIGFHGHTIMHRPEIRRTWQIGDGGRLATRLGVPVVCDFRSDDVAAGGQGAPLVPVYHRALARDLPRPLAILNIGGVANVTWVGTGGDDILSFDTGPGNAPIDDWMLSHTSDTADWDGLAALAGHADAAFVDCFLADPYFARPAPKSLDRDHFAVWRPDHLGLADGAATLTECVAAAVAVGASQFPEPAREWLITGGGRHNPALMQALARRLARPVRQVDAIGWDGDALEAQAFGYLAVRAVRKLPLSFPGTTGVPRPLSGGRYFAPAV